MVHKKEEGTYHRNEKSLDSLVPGKACQRIPDRSKTAHKKPPVKFFLTLNEVVKPGMYIWSSYLRTLKSK